LIIGVLPVYGVNAETLAIGAIGFLSRLRPLPTLPLLLRWMLTAVFLRLWYDVALAVIPHRGLLRWPAVNLTLLDIATPLILFLHHPGSFLATTPSTLASYRVLEVGMTLGFLVLIM
jgi:hypothetical protein